MRTLIRTLGVMFSFLLAGAMFNGIVVAQDCNHKDGFWLNSSGTDCWTVGGSCSYSTYDTTCEGCASSPYINKNCATADQYTVTVKEISYGRCPGVPGGSGPWTCSGGYETGSHEETCHYIQSLMECQ